VLHQRFEVTPVGVQQGNAAFERFGEGDFAVHAQVGDPLDFGHDLPAARVALQGNVGQFFHRLYLGKSAVKVNDEVTGFFGRRKFH
jgi:hypothetical protein